MNTVERRLDAHRASRRYVDVHGQVHIKVLPKEYYVTDQAIALITVLGSCVSVCLRDSAAGVGGMNHFMLPDPPGTATDRAQSMVYGGYAIQRLLDALYAEGAHRDRLEAKIFGAGNVLADMRIARIGDANAVFAEQHLSELGIAVIAKDLGGEWPRQLQYFPATGRARVRRLRTVEPILAEREQAVVDNSVAGPMFAAGA